MIAMKNVYKFHKMLKDIVVYFVKIQLKRLYMNNYKLYIKQNHIKRYKTIKYFNKT